MDVCQRSTRFNRLIIGLMLFGAAWIKSTPILILAIAIIIIDSVWPGKGPFSRLYTMVKGPCHSQPMSLSELRFTNNMMTMILLAIVAAITFSYEQIAWPATYVVGFLSLMAAAGFCVGAIFYAVWRAMFKQSSHELKHVV